MYLVKRNQKNMRDSDYYPAGAYNDPNAPYNQSEPQETDFDVNVRTTLQKDTTIWTSDYNPEYDDETGRIYYNTDETNWVDAYKDACYTPLELIELFKECLEFLKENNIRWGNKMDYQIKELIENCEGWNEEEFEVDY